VTATKGKVFEKYRFMGISLSGGKTQRTHLAVVDYFPVENKIFLSHLYRDIGEDGGLSADTVLLNLISENKENLQSISIDAPLTDPPSLLVDHKCVGPEDCDHPELKWMWAHHKKQHKNKRPNKIFTPYTERPVEQFLATSLEQTFPLDHALGSNRAPLWARAKFLSRRLKGISLLETYPRISVWRIGRALKISKTPLLYYKNSVEGAHCREQILEKFLDAEWLFIYSQDTKHMVKDAHVFEAVMSAYTAFLAFKNLCEPPPKDFPKGSGWVSFPKPDFPASL
jgi:hypothetical protein